MDRFQRCLFCACTHRDSDIREHIHGTMEDFPSCKLKTFLSSQWICFKVSFDEQDPVRTGSQYGGPKTVLVNI